jgi:hypothetical protein
MDQQNDVTPNADTGKPVLTLVSPPEAIEDETPAWPGPPPGVARTLAVIALVVTLGPALILLLAALFGRTL